MASVFQRALQCISALENYVFKSTQFRFPPALAPAYVNLPAVPENKSLTKNLNELLNDAILWAVPKKRRTLEKRRTRKFGIIDRYYKMYVPKTNILTCQKCGDYYEAGYLCNTCYGKIKKITTEMQETIQKELGNSPVEKEVVVLYDGEKTNPEFYKGKRIIEMKKEKPKLFSSNLLQRTTQGPAKTKELFDPQDLRHS